jgi:hypothetical protein
MTDAQCIALMVSMRIGDMIFNAVGMAGELARAEKILTDAKKVVPETIRLYAREGHKISLEHVRRSAPD